MIGEAVLALEYGASSEDIARTTHAHVRFLTLPRMLLSTPNCFGRSQRCPRHSVKPPCKRAPVRRSTFREEQKRKDATPISLLMASASSLDMMDLWYLFPSPGKSLYYPCQHE